MTRNSENAFGRTPRLKALYGWPNNPTGVLAPPQQTAKKRFRNERSQVRRVRRRVARLVGQVRERQAAVGGGKLAGEEETAFGKPVQKGPVMKLFSAKQRHSNGPNRKVLFLGRTFTPPLTRPIFRL